MIEIDVTETNVSVSLPEQPAITISQSPETVSVALGITDHVFLSNIGENTHAQIDTYIQNLLIGGSMYNDNTDYTVNVLAMDTHYEVGGGMTGASLNQMTFQNSKELKCLVAGTYEIHWSMSAQTSANQEIEGGIMVNSATQPNGSAHTNNTAANRPSTISGHARISLSVNDVVKLCIANHSSTADIVVNHASVTARWVGV